MLQYIYDGVVYGFPIVDYDAQIPSYDCYNYKSALVGPANEFIAKLFETEIGEHKLVRVLEKPRCINAIGAVPKGPDKFCPIADCRRPISDSVNNFMMSEDNVTSVLVKGDFLAMVDTAGAYRSVSICPDHRKFMGLH